MQTVECFHLVNGKTVLEYNLSDQGVALVAMALDNGFRRIVLCDPPHRMAIRRICEQAGVLVTETEADLLGFTQPMVLDIPPSLLLRLPHPDAA